MINCENQNLSHTAAAVADKKVRSGNFEIKKKNFVQALIDFSEAIALNPNNCLYRIKRYECLVEMKEYDKALDDAMYTVRIDEKYRLGYYKLMDCYLLMGRIEDAEEIISKFRIIAPQIDSIDRNQVIKIQKYKKLKIELANLIAVNDFDNSLKCINDLLKIAPASIDHQLRKVQHLVLLERFDEAKSQRVANSSSYLIAEALQFYYDGDLENSIRLFQQVKTTSLNEISLLDDIRERVVKLLAGLPKGFFFWLINWICIYDFLFS